MYGIVGASVLATDRLDAGSCNFDLRSGLDFLGIFGRGGAALAGTVEQLRAQRLVEFVRGLRIVLEVLAGVLLALPDPFTAVAVPGPRLLDQVVGDAHLDQLAFARGTLAVEDLELGLAEWRRHLVLHHLDAGLRTD